MSTYPPGLDKLIQEQDIAAISNTYLIPTIQLAATDLSQLTLLQHIVTRLLDIEQEHDDIVEIEDLITISTTCAPVVQSLEQTEGSDEKQNVYHIQGLLLWLGVNSALMLLGDLVNNERKYLSNPTAGFTQLDDQGSILSTVHAIIPAYTFVIRHVREFNHRLQLFHLHYNIAYHYLLYLNGLYAYFQDKFADACSYYQQSSNTATILLQLIATNYSTQEQITTLNLGDKLTIAKFSTILQKNQSQHFYESLKLLPILPQTKQKVKLLSLLITDPQFETGKAQLNEQFLSSGQYQTLINAVATDLIPPQEQYTTLIPTSLTNITSKIYSYQLLSKFELAIIAAMYKIPFNIIKELTFPTKHIKFYPKQ